MAAVSLHPLASRSGVQSATVVSVNLPSCEGVENQSTPTLASQGPVDGNTHQQSHFGSSQTAFDQSANPFNDSHSAQYDEHDEHDDDDEGEERYGEERYAQQCWQDETQQGPEWGLHHTDLDQYPVLFPDDGSDSWPPIRAMTAKQFADLQRRYADLDVPHSVVFPFLHGVDGDNAAQNAFFRAPLTGMPTPYYRGLTVVRADMPTHEQQNAMNRKRASSSASKLSHVTSSQRSRADSLATTASAFSNDSSGSSEEESNGVANLPLLRKNQVPASHSTSSVSSSNHSRTSSLFSRPMSSDTTASSTCLDSDSFKVSEAAAYHARAARNRNSLRRNPLYEPQPAHSHLNSSILPAEVLNPPLMANLVTNTLEVARQASLPGEDHCCINGATFVKPKQAEGISLRNFKTQCAKYATISDIVIYCPAGLHQGAVTLAQWVRQAQETCLRERVARGLGGLRYNVFVITDSFDVFEREQPHLIAVDAGGFSRNRVDFIEREREEMQRFTEATEIDDNVWLGCTANVPYALDEIDQQGSSVSLDSYLPEEVNPNAFSICIEAVEQAAMPTASRLNHASHFLDAFEATALFELNSKEALRQLEEEDESDGVEDDRPSLGPNGWSPSSRSRQGSYRRSNPAFRQHSLHPPPSSIIHFKAIGSGSCFEEETGMEEAIENIVSMCVWIKKQSCPSAKTTPTHNAHSLLHGALRYGRSNAWPKHQQQLPRRVLLHCSDGYTDTSILALAYLMYSRNLSLPEAYLDLQNRCNRCFFVYGRDVPFLQQLSHRLALESKLLYSHSPEKSRNSFSWSINSSNDDVSSSAKGSSRRTRRYSNEEGSPPFEQSVWARGLAAATGLVTSAQGPGAKKSNSSLRGGGAQTIGEVNRTSTPTPRSTPTPSSPHHDMQQQQSQPTPTPVKDHRWFTSPHFQGSFPSKILPFLYLGNLSHALNPAMLHAIGITHVVSVGESALVPPDVEESVMGAAAVVQCGVSVKHHRKKRSSNVERHDTLWEEERQGRISVLDLQNVSDDGIDSLRPHMSRAIEYIEQARLQGGRVLVHCRVGVSRSATVCIAYAMAHCDLSMIESFLLVRSRRMNVLTQPTLLFVWELRGFEARLARLKAERLQREQGDLVMRDIHDDDFSLAALSISSNGSKSASEEGHECVGSKELQVDVGAGAGSVYGFQVDDYRSRPFNSGSLTRLNYHSAKLTHGYFCKLLSELNSRYMVA